jgi:hypothetical protein
LATMPPRDPNTPRPMISIIVTVFVLVLLFILIFPAINATKVGVPVTMNDLTQLCTAIKAYHTDYGVYPIDASAEWKDRAMYDFPGSEHHNFELLNTLRADGVDPGPNHGNAINTHDVVYLDVPYVKDSSHPSEGLSRGNENDGRNINVSGEWYDKWGNPYAVAINVTAKGIPDLRFIYSDARAADSNQPEYDVAAISFGADGKPGIRGNGKYDGSDDIAEPPAN